MPIEHSLLTLRNDIADFISDKSGIVDNIYWKGQDIKKASYPYLTLSVLGMQSNGGLADYNSTKSGEVTTMVTTENRMITIEVDIYSKSGDGASKDSIILMDDLMTNARTIVSAEFLTSKSLALRSIRNQVTIPDFIENEYIWRANTEMTFSYLSIKSEEIDYFNTVETPTITIV